MENDDERLAAAFRAAVQDTPAAGFDHEDVLAGSRRLARRRRMLLTGGVAAAVIVLAGGVTTGVVLTRDDGAVTSAAAPAPERAGPGSVADAAAPRAAAAPSAPAPGAPLGPAAGDCVNPQDPQLRALVDAALPALAGAQEAPTTMICRPGGGREVNLEVADGALTGLFTVVYTPAGEPPAQTATAVGWVTAEAPTASGGTVVVTSRGALDSGGVPFADDVRPLADALGPRL
ncbi:hypothetical protein LWC33_32050 [Pseudonocardia sp. RS11V-5]|uniref:hypothetical protein n=1 Tax=Pseudonocardia terrae TaxID=2905831 RepID=UPI001E49E552|nr:hypothetical protein [Pseudonocardia terrae]MCE3556062.1 hypothetical protein [Pseudonocardia terrae]